MEKTRKRAHSPKISKKELLKRLKKLENDVCHSRSRSRSRFSRSYRSRSNSRNSQVSESQYPSDTDSCRHAAGISTPPRQYLVNRREGHLPRGMDSPRKIAEGRDLRGPNSNLSPDIGQDGQILRDLESNDNQETVENDNVGSPILTIHNEIELPEEVLNILGDDPQKPKSNSFHLHPQIVNRWSHIIQNGLDKDEKGSLLGKYTCPDNCRILTAPLINPEIKSVMTTPHISRDTTHYHYQEQLGSGLSALGAALNTIFEEGENIPNVIKEKLLKSVVDSSRILCNLFNNISYVRRSLVSPMLSKSVAEIVSKTPPEDFLFAADLNEKIKAAKQLEKIGKDLRFTNRLPSASFPRKERGGAATSRSSYVRPAQQHFKTGQYSTGKPLNRKRPTHYPGEVKSRRGGHPSNKDKKSHRSYH